MTQPSLITFPNGDKPQPTFSSSEMEGRLAKLRRSLEQQGVDVALFTSHHNINYYADFLYCSFGRLFGLVVGFDSQTSISANLDGGQPWRRTFGENLVYTDWQSDNYFRAVQKLIKDGQTVGVEFDHLSAQNMEKLAAALPKSRFIDIAPASMMLRMVKSDEEIAHITEMTRIADLGGAAGVEGGRARSGRARSCAAFDRGHGARDRQKLAARRVGATPGPGFNRGVNTDGAHNPVTSRRIESGDILSLNCFPMVAGYYVALERTLFCQSATDEHLRLWEINCRVHDAGKALIVPGVRCCDIAGELNQIYREYDLLKYRSFGYGHSFGVLCHYYGREAGLELREDIETVLAPNMVVSMEPMITIPEGMAGAGGYREHDILVVTEDGNRNITGFPYGPEHNIISAPAN